jgi:N-acetylneuraminic acid mutarotase
MRSIGNFWVGVGLSLSLFPQCGSKIEDPGSDSSTHFFSRCDADAECGEGLSCECNRCTLRCAATNECGTLANSSCEPASALDGCNLEVQLCVPSDGPGDAGSTATDGVEPALSSNAELSSPTDNSSTESDDSDATTESDVSDTDTAVDTPLDDTSSEVVDELCGLPLSAYVFTSATTCAVAMIGCDPMTESPFSNECGCGCDTLLTPEPEPNDSEEAPQNGCLGQAGCPWSERADLPLPSRGQVAVVFDGLVYLLGGITPGAFQEPVSEEAPPPQGFADLLAYAPEADSWSAKAPMPVGLYDLTAHRLGERIYVFSGYNFSGFVNVVQVYDPATDNWGQAAPMPTYRYTFVSGVVDGKAYVIGGQGTVDNAPSSGQDWEYKYDVEIFDPETDSWSKGTPAPEAMASAASCTLGSKIFVFGGEISNLTSIYDTSTDSWSTGTPPPHAKDGHECAVVDSSLFLFGGRDTTGTLSTVDRYDPATDTWEAYSPMPTPRYWFAAAALDHNVFAFGGEQFLEEFTQSNNYGLLSSVEVLSIEPLLADP